MTVRSVRESIRDGPKRIVQTSSFDSGMDSGNGEQLIYNGEETIEDEERTPIQIPILNGEIVNEEDDVIKIDSIQLKKEVRI